VIAFPHAKINLGLHVLAKRADGYHSIETVLIPVQWYDALEAIPAPEFQVQHSTPMPWLAGDDIIARAVDLLRQETPLPATSLFLHKAVPNGAGLGGGSSDAAHTLMLLNALHGLNLSAERLHDLAAQLGADCPFFLHRRPMLASGTGTHLTPIEPGLSGLWLMVVVPEVRIETKWAYANATPKASHTPLSEILAQPQKKWRDILVNDFEETVFRVYPAVGELKQRMYEAGALYASMSGSGSAVFGLFERQPEPEYPAPAHIEQLA
jgi:4-diphosphocytidyl-2-C-methyl-D-erythritol kinase